MASIGGVTDISTLVSQLISLERSSGPIALYQSDKSALTQRNATLTDLRSNLSALRTQATALAQPGSLSPFQAKQVSSSQPAVTTATATTSGVSGSHALRVSQLAKRSRLASDQLTQTGGELLAATGAGERSFRITVGGKETVIAVTLEAGETNQQILTKMASAVNASDAEVTASVVSDTGSTARLVLTGAATGAANAIELADVSGTLLAAAGAESGVAASGVAGGYLYAPGELDAVFVLDGLTMSRSGNSVSDAIPGVTLNLLAAQEESDAALTLTVGPDQEAIKGKLKAFFDAYNTAIKFLKERTSTSVSSTTAASGTTEVTEVNRGTLAGETIYQGLLMDLRRIAGGRIGSGASGGPVSLSEIGITAAADGTLSITDTSKFETALTRSADAVSSLFDSQEGIAAQMNERLAAFVNTGGILDGSLASASARISTINAAIEMQEKALKVREEVLLKQYTALQETLAQLSSQQTTLDLLTAGS